MSTFEYPSDSVAAFRVAAVYRSDVSAMRKYFSEDPDVFCKLRESKKWVVCEAARRASPEVVKVLIELGANIDEQDSNGFTGLSVAVNRGRYDIARMLLDNGANPSVGCAIFDVACGDLEDRVAMAKLLLDHGADVNQPFIVKDLPPRNVLSEAIARGQTDLVAFLKAHGAELPRQQFDVDLAQGGGVGAATEDYTHAILAHFRKYFGDPKERVIQEIVPTSKYPVMVHYIPPSASKRRGFPVVFTTGLSMFHMPVPEGLEEYRHAELMLVLDKAWPSPEKAIKDPQWAWPITWLRKIAAYPIEHRTWLGSRWTTIGNGEPPQPLGPGTKFTAWGLASPRSEECVVHFGTGIKIQLYQLFPLYTEEYWLEQTHGFQALMARIKECGMPEHIDIHRMNVAAS